MNPRPRKDPVLDMKCGVTDVSLEILDIIRAHVAKHGFPPSVRELVDILGFRSTSSVHYHLVSLERRGLILRSPNRSRAITLMGPTEKVA